MILFWKDPQHAVLQMLQQHTPPHIITTAEWNTWSDPGGKDAKENRRTALWIMNMVTLVIYHHPFEDDLDKDVSAESWQISAPSSDFTPTFSLFEPPSCLRNRWLRQKLIHAAVTKTRLCKLDTVGWPLWKFRDDIASCRAKLSLRCVPS